MRIANTPSEKALSRSGVALWSTVAPFQCNEAKLDIGTTFVTTERKSVPSLLGVEEAHKAWLTSPWLILNCKVSRYNWHVDPAAVRVPLRMD
jgi:hypothetical protein